jgi:hypothetical protein
MDASSGEPGLLYGECDCSPLRRGEWRFWVTLQFPTPGASLPETRTHFVKGARLGALEHLQYNTTLRSLFAFFAKLSEFVFAEFS